MLASAWSAASMARTYVVVKPGVWKVSTKNDKSKVERLVQRGLHTAIKYATCAKDGHSLPTDDVAIPTQNLYCMVLFSPQGYHEVMLDASGAASVHDVDPQAHKNRNTTSPRNIVRIQFGSQAVTV